MGANQITMAAFAHLLTFPGRFTDGSQTPHRDAGANPAAAGPNQFISVPGWSGTLLLIIRLSPTDAFPKSTGMMY